MPVAAPDIQKPKFDPNKKFETVGKPKFDPSQKFEPVGESAPVPQSTITEAPKNDIHSQMLNFDVSKLNTGNPPTSESQPVSNLHEEPASIIPDSETLKIKNDEAGNRLLKNVAPKLDKTLSALNDNQADRDYKQIVEKHKRGEISQEDFDKATAAYTSDVILNRAQRLKESQDKFANDPYFQKHVIQHIADNNPKIAKQIQADAYVQSAINRPQNASQIIKNSRDIEGGDLSFNIRNQQLQKNENFAQSTKSAFENRNKILSDYDKYTSGSDQDAINTLEDKRINVNPDDPTGGTTGFGATVGGQGMLLAKGAGAAGLTSLIPGVGEALAPWAAGAATSPEVYKTSYATSLERNYNELRGNGTEPADAYHTAKDRAQFDAKADVASNIVANVVGAKIGLRGFKSAEVSPSYIKIIDNIANHIGRTTAEGSAIGGTAATGEVLKNIHSGKPAGEGALDAAQGQLLFAYGIAGLTHAASAFVKPKTRETILQNVAKAPDEPINNTLQTLVQHGKLSPEEATDIHTEIKTQKESDAKIPPNVKSDNARADIKKMLEKREGLEISLDNLGKSFHPEVKEKIKALDEKITATANEGKQHDEGKEVELPFQKPEEKPSVSVIRPEENTQPNIVPLKTEEVKPQLPPIGSGDRPYIHSGGEMNKSYTLKDENGGDAIFYNGGGNLDSKTGIYFTPNKDLANSFATGRGAFREELHGAYDPAKKSTKVTEGALITRNPKKIQYEGKEITPQEIEQYKKDGHDSIISYANGDIREVVVFDKSQIKSKENAIPESTTGTMGAHAGGGESLGGSVEGSGVGSGIEGNEAPKEGVKEGEAAGQEKVNPLETVTGKGETVGITHEKMNELSRELGIPEYTEAPETIAGWDKEADDRIAKDPQAISKLLNKMRNGDMPDHVEQRMILKYVADLKARWNETKSDAILTQIKRVKDLSNIMGGRAVGKSLRARQDEIPIEKTLPDFMIREMESSGVDHLTEGQKKKATTDYEKISSAEEDYKTKSEKLEAEVAKLKAEKEFAKTKGSKSTTKPTEGKPRDFAAERKALLDEYKNKKASETTKRQGGPITDEDVKLVAKLLKNYVEEGVENLKEVVGKIHDVVKDNIQGITDKDIHNIIAGEYNPKKPTRNELAAKVVDLKNEAKLINRIEKIEAGEPTTEKAKVKKNQALKELQDKIHDLTKDEKSLKTIKARNESELARVQAEIDKGNFEPDKKKPSILESEEAAKKYPELFKAASEARDKLMKVKQDRETRLMKQQFDRKNKYQKFGHYTLQALNTPRTLMSSIDFSAPLRQGLIPTIAHPDLALKAAKLMFRSAFSQKAFDEWFHGLRASPEFKIMKDSDLYVADPHDYRLTAREEAYMSNMAEKIPVAGKWIAGSERAYVAYLNKMRVDMFNRGAEILSSEGKTFKNSEDAYKALAKWVNNATGRGDLGGLQAASPVLNAVFFSPRLIASRVNLLTQWFNPLYYKNTPKAIRVMAIKDMAKFIGFGLTVLGAAKMAGAQVEDDARSADFGKIKVGNTRYDIWGGFQQYIRLMAQVMTASAKSTNTGKIYELNGKGAFGKTILDPLETFGRNKLSPLPSMAIDFATHRNSQGQPVTPGKEIAEHFSPLLFTDIYDAMQSGDVKSAILPAAASTFGVGVQTYQPPQKKSKHFD